MGIIRYLVVVIYEGLYQKLWKCVSQSTLEL
jgi:hypothetical protein